MNLYIGNSTVVEIQSLTNSVTSVVDTGATMSCTITDLGGTEVTGETWPVTMSHAAAGTYRGVVDSAVSLVSGKEYIVEINATGTGGEVGKWAVRLEAENRGCC